MLINDMVWSFGHWIFAGSGRLYRRGSRSQKATGQPRTEQGKLERDALHRGLAQKIWDMTGPGSATIHQKCASNAGDDGYKFGANVAYALSMIRSMNRNKVFLGFVFAATSAVLGLSESTANAWFCQLYDWGLTPLDDSGSSAPSCPIILVNSIDRDENYDTAAWMFAYAGDSGPVAVSMTVERRVETIDVGRGECDVATCSYESWSTLDEYVFYILTPDQELPANREVVLIDVVELSPGVPDLVNSPVVTWFDIGGPEDGCKTIENDFFPYCSGPPCEQVDGCIPAGNGESGGCRATEGSATGWLVGLVILFLFARRRKRGASF